MLLPNHLFVLLMSVPILVYSSVINSYEQKPSYEGIREDSDSSRETVAGMEEYSNVEANVENSSVEATRRVEEQKGAGSGNDNCTRTGKEEKGKDQDTIFPNCSWGEGSESNDRNNSTSTEKPTTSITEQVQTPTSTQTPSTNITEQVQNPTSTQAPSISTTEQVPGRQHGCNTLPDPGECRGAFPRFFYDHRIDQCDCFLFGGCDEELVVFTWLTLQKCLDTCVPGNRTMGARCEKLIQKEIQTFPSPKENPVNNASNDLINERANTP